VERLVAVVVDTVEVYPFRDGEKRRPLVVAVALDGNIGEVN